MPRLHIAIIAPPWLPVPPRAYGGTEAVIDQLALGLVAAGHAVRLITVAPAREPLPDVETPGLAHLCAPPGTVLLRGIVLAPPQATTLWLSLEGAGSVPLAPASPAVEATLRDLVEQRVIIQGACVAQGIAVDTVQAVQEN